MPRIDSVSWLPAGIRYEDEIPTPFVDSWGAQLFVKVSLSDGSAGWGEVLAYGSSIVDAYAGVLEDVVAPAARGEQLDGVGRLRELLSRLERLLFTAGLCGVVNGALGGFEMAALDALARSSRSPLWSLLGASSRSEIPVYASLPRYSRPEDAVRAVERAVGWGFTMVKLHQPPGEALEYVRAVREAVGYDVDLALDLNGGLDREAALELANSLARYELEWVEEPVWPVDDRESLAWLASRSPIPVAAGENEHSLRGLLELARAGVKVVQPDISKLGGALKLLEAARALAKEGAIVAPHLRPHRSFLAHAFVLHVAAVEPDLGPVEWPSGPLAYDAFDAPRLEVRGGLLDASPLLGSAGVGVAVREDVVASRYRYSKAFRPLVFH